MEIVLKTLIVVVVILALTAGPAYTGKKKPSYILHGCYLEYVGVSTGEKSSYDYGIKPLYIAFESDDYTLFVDRGVWERYLKKEAKESTIVDKGETNGTDK